MRKSGLLIFAFFAFASISIISCAQPNADNEKASKTEATSETRTAGVTYTLVDASYNFNLTITFNNDGTNSLSPSEKTSIGTYLNSRFSFLNFSNVSSTDAAFYYDANDQPKERVSVLGFGLDGQSKDVPIGFVFNGNGDGTGSTLSFSGSGSGTEHSCAGAPCDCCGFIYKEHDGGLLGGTYKQIIGCKCNSTSAECFTTNGRCDHTITSKS